MGEKDPGRRTKRKARSARYTIDNELAQLAEVLAEMQLDNTAYGWFRPPWRRGEWPVQLCLEAARLTFDSVSEDYNAARDLASAPIHDGYVYEAAGALYNRLVQPKVNTDCARFIAAAMRCLQLKIANSHGGGVVYNEVMIPAFLSVEPRLVENAVLEYRCLDSIGTTHFLAGDRNDRQRAAFTTAWRRGLYLAAYSLPPAF